jgi:integrin beta 3
MDPLVTTGMIRRAEMRRQLRVAQQLKVATLVVVAVLLLAAYPAYLFTRTIAQDPVLGELDGLNLPSWAAIQHDDVFSGSRWCIGQCRYRERTWESQHNPQDTNTAYVSALNDAGWRPRTDGVCPTVSDGIATCWKRDAYVMDMWVRAPVCDIPPTRPVTGGATPSPSPSPQSGSDNSCAAALVTVKVFNAIDYHPVD